MHPQQQYYQGNMQGPSIQSPESILPIQQQQQQLPFSNQYQQPTNEHIAGQAPLPSIIPSERYLVGNLSEPFSFHVAPSSTRVTYLGLNGYSLYITGMGFSNKSKFNYDELNNRLTIISLDSTTVGASEAVAVELESVAVVLEAVAAAAVVLEVAAVVLEAAAVVVLEVVVVAFVAVVDAFVVVETYHY
ncbi:unnamed protein product [Rotaria sp. Silwood1]|nr:unnamed protein product [Rotaria sp. Silwood1]